VQHDPVGNTSDSSLVSRGFEPLQKLLLPHCSVLVGSINGFKHVFTIKLNYNKLRALLKTKYAK